MKKTYIVVLLGVALLLSGCAAEVVSELYIQDIVDVLETDEEILANATIAVESLGSDYIDNVVELIGVCFRDATNFREQARDYSSYILADVKLPVVDITYGDTITSEDLISLVVASNPEEDESLFGIAVNQELFASVAQYVEDEFWQTLSFSDASLYVRLINDTRETVGLVLQNVYVNQEPVLYSEDYELARRDTLEIRLSDIMRDYAYNEGYVIIGAVK